MGSKERDGRLRIMVKAAKAAFKGKQKPAG